MRLASVTVPQITSFSEDICRTILLLFGVISSTNLTTPNLSSVRLANNRIWLLSRWHAFRFYSRVLEQVVSFRLQMYSSKSSNAPREALPRSALPDPERKLFTDVRGNSRNSVSNSI